MAAGVLGVARATLGESLGPAWCAEIRNLSWEGTTRVPFDFLVHFSTL